MKFLSCNKGGFNALSKHKSLQLLRQQASPRIILLQKIKVEESKFEVMKQLVCRGDYIVANPTLGNS